MESAHWRVLGLNYSSDPTRAERKPMLLHITIELTPDAVRLALHALLMLSMLVT
jgi:hypothetical protein